MTSTIPSIPAQNTLFLYVNNLQVSNDATTPNTKLNVAVGQCRDDTNTYDIVLDSANINYSASVTGFVVNLAVTGLNGLDRSSLVASTPYYLYAIAASNGFYPSGFLVSASATAPTMPFGYDLKRLIDYQITDSSAHLIAQFNVGNGNERQKVYANAIRVITSGTASTLTAIDLSAAVPPVQNTLVTLNGEFTPATASDNVKFFPGDSSATVGPSIAGSVAAKVNSGQVQVLARLASSVAKIKYINSAASGNTDAWVQGFKYFI